MGIDVEATVKQSNDPKHRVKRPSRLIPLFLSKNWMAGCDALNRDSRCDDRAESVSIFVFTIHHD